MAKITKREWRQKAHSPKNRMQRSMTKEWKRVKAEEANQDLAEFHEAELVQQFEEEVAPLVDDEVESLEQD